MACNYNHIEALHQLKRCMNVMTYTLVENSSFVFPVLPVRRK